MTKTLREIIYHLIQWLLIIFGSIPNSLEFGCFFFFLPEITENMPIYDNRTTKLAKY